MCLRDPGHRPVGAIAFATGAEKYGRAAGDEQRAVERGCFSGNQLRTQIGKIADIFILPDEERIELSLFAPVLGVGNSLLPQRADVNSRFISHLKLSPCKSIHLVLRSCSAIPPRLGAHSPSACFPP